MSQALESLDRSFLSIDTETTHQLVAIMAMLESRPDIERIRQRAMELFDRFPRMKQCIEDIDGDLYWQEDEQFDVTHHIEQVDLPSCETREDFFSSVAAKYSERMKMDRPLWRFTLFCSENGERSQYAMLFAAHHAFTDGVGGMKFIESFYDTKPEIVSPANLSPRNEDSEDETQRSFWADTSRLRRFASFLRLIAEGLNPGNTCALNRANSSKRRLSCFEVDLKDVRNIKSRMGVSINDIALGIVTSGVRRYLQRLGAELSNPLAIMPISARKVSEKYALGNYLTGVGVRLPVTEADPKKQLSLIHREVERLESDGSFGAYALLGHISARLPRFLRRRVLEAQARRTGFICTNIPAASRPRYLAGAKVVAQYALPALMRGHGVGFGVMTYAGKFCVSVVADDALPYRPEEISAELAGAFDQLAA